MNRVIQNTGRSLNHVVNACTKGVAYEGVWRSSVRSCGKLCIKKSGERKAKKVIDKVYSNTTLTQFT